MTPATMRVARLHGVGDLRVETVPVPQPDAGELLVRVEACGVCPTDVRKFVLGLRPDEYPLNPGHEWVGRVEAVGAGVEGWAPGERLYGDTYAGYGEYAVLRASAHGWSAGAVRLDDGLPVDRAVFVEPLADCLHAVLDQGRVGPEDRVLVVGAGQMGLQLVAVAARAARRVLAADGVAERRALAAELGAATVVGRDEWAEAARSFRPTVAILSIGEASLVRGAAGRPRARRAAGAVRGLRRPAGRHARPEPHPLPRALGRRQRVDRHAAERAPRALRGGRGPARVGRGAGGAPGDGALRPGRAGRRLRRGAGAARPQDGARAGSRLMPGLFARDGRAVVVAIDHPLYTWPCPGLESREELISEVVAAGADALIASYGTVRDCRAAFGTARAILKLDLTVLSVDGYRPADWVVAYAVEDAVRLRADAVLTLIEPGTPGELAELAAAARVAAAADRAGLPYVCEILPATSEAFPDPFAPRAIAGAARAAAELGAHVVKTSIPTPPSAVAEAVGCGVPVLLAGGEIAGDREAYLAGLGGRDGRWRGGRRRRPQRVGRR